LIGVVVNISRGDYLGAAVDPNRGVPMEGHFSFPENPGMDQGESAGLARSSRR
jgi:hypothetical protein